MLWHALHPINLDGLAGGALREAQSLNLRIHDLVTYRQKVEMQTATHHKSRPGTPYDEAIRREVVLRTDIERFNTAAGISGVENLVFLRAAAKILTERGTHTVGGAT